MLYLLLQRILHAYHVAAILDEARLFGFRFVRQEQRGIAVNVGGYLVFIVRTDIIQGDFHHFLVRIDFLLDF